MEKTHKFLLISIDCWRYNALSRTNPLFNTPKFDLSTQDFSLAERFFVTAPATRPSHTSLFTGLYPFEHGLYGQTYLKMFAGIPNLFQLFADAGYDVMGKSERSDVFRFLDFESFIMSIDLRAKDQHIGSLESLIAWIDQPSAPHQFGFIHFWHTHGGYGLGGIQNAPNLREWVHQGRTEEALRFYYAAVTHVLEFAIVEILKRVSLEDWAVFIFGDHGEGFCEEIMAHGDTLHQNVLHVPLLAHIPGRDAIQFPEGPTSIIDLFPTITRLAGINVDYQGYGRDLLGSSDGFEERWVLSELDSLYGIGFLTPSNLQTDPSRVTSRVSMDGVELDRYPEGVRLWAITDGWRLYRENEETGDFVQRDVMSGADLPCDHPDKFRSIYNQIRANSRYQNPEMQETTAEEGALLEERLRDLGYIE
jgi:membrane-anchored protein YejM (alkaline phosphatase superfamily)